METKIIKIMAERNIRQVELARATRIDKSRICCYANGAAFPSAVTLARLARALGCKPAELQEVAK